MSKKGSGPPPIEITSKPTIPPLHDDGQEALAFPDQALTDVEPDARDLLSNVLPNGLTNPYATVENGWAVGPQPVDPSSGAPGPSGPLAAYEGANVEALSGAPAGAEANTATGGPAADPYETSRTLEELWTALGGKSVDRSQELALNAPSGSAAPTPVDDASDQQPLHRSIISTLNDPDWGSGTSITVDMSQLADGSKSAGSVQTIPEVTIVGSPFVSGSSDQALMQAIQASMHGAGGQASLGGGAAPPATISEVLVGTDWARPDDAAQLPPQASSQAAPAQPPAPVSPQPGAGQPNPAPYDPMADSALDRFLLRGELPYVGAVPAVAAAMNVVTNDRNLQKVQTGAEALAITAAIAAAAVAAAAAAPAAIAATNNFFATAATGAQTYVPLVAAAGAATNPAVQQVAPRIVDSLPSLGNSLGGFLSRMSGSSPLGPANAQNLGQQVSKVLGSGVGPSSPLGGQMSGNLPSSAGPAGQQVPNAVNAGAKQLQDFGYQFHHWFPQQEEQRFDDLGLDVHEYTTLISPEFHILLHSEGWNEAWSEWLDEAVEQGYSAEAAVEQLSEMLQPYLQQMQNEGISGPHAFDAIVPYPGR